MEATKRLVENDKTMPERVENAATCAEKVEPNTASFDLADEDIDLASLEVVNDGRSLGRLDATSNDLDSIIPPAEFFAQHLKLLEVLSPDDHRAVAAPRQGAIEQSQLGIPGFNDKALIIGHKAADNLVELEF